jgi:prolyl-tRNA editing enzyme YbaK/EbsC (Cys-tRNA(Pro) deacylase)
VDHQPLSVDDVRRALTEHGLEPQELPLDTSTAPLAAEALGTSVSAIVKSLLFMAGDEPVLCLVAGDKRLDHAAVAALLAVPSIRLAKPREVIEYAGYAVGGVPPVAHRRPLRTLIDRNLLAQPVVYAAAGAANTIFPVESARLPEITGGEIADIAS